MPGKLILHIGLHKTGTSSIQFALFQLRKELESAGFSYPVTEKWAHHELCEEIRSSEESSLQSDFFAHVSSSSFHTYIVSSEGFDVFTPEEMGRLTNFVDQSGLDPHVIYYIRNQADMLESSIKGTKNLRLLARSEEETEEKIGQRFPWKFKSFYDAWASEFGASNLTVEIYENQKDSITRFFDCAGIRFDNSTLDRALAQRKNVSVDSNLVAATQHIVRRSRSLGFSDETIESSLMPLLRSIGDQMRNSALKSPEVKTPGVSLISRELRKRMEQMFRAENLAFSEQIKPLPECYFSFTRERVEGCNLLEECVDLLIRANLSQTLHTN